MTLAVAIVTLTALTVALPFLDRYLGRRAGWLVGVVFAALAVALLPAAAQVLAGGVVVLDRPWIPALGIGLHLRLDGLALVFTLMVLVVGALVKFYSARYFPPGRHGALFTILTLFALSMLGVVLADDLVLLYVSWELTTICSFLLIGRKGTEARSPAVRTVVTTFAGGLALLVAVVLLWRTTGTTRISEIVSDTSWMQEDGIATAVLVLLLVAAFAKSAQFPLHFWLPDAMAASTPVSAYLHAATMVKAGVYLVLRFSPAYAEDPRWQLTLLAVGLFTAVYGGVLALSRRDLKEVLAYSTVSQLGLMMATAGVGTAEALVAVSVHVVAHALFKATLFMTAGIVEHESGTRDLHELSGLRRTMPATGAVATLAAASLAGLPPLLGFVSKEKLFTGFVGADSAVVSWLGGGLAVLASALTVAYAYRFLTPYLGGTNRTAAAAHEAPTLFLLGPALGALAGLWLGVHPGRLEDLARRLGADVAGHETHTSLALWHGLTPELFMSLTALAAGAVLCVVHRPVTSVLERCRSPVSGTELFDRITGGLMVLGRGISAPTAGFAPARHLLAPLVVLSLLAAVALPLDVSPHPAPVTRGTDWLLLVPLVAAVLGAVTVRSRMAVMVLSSMAGLMVGAWFLAMGGADLAMTQLLVEVLVVVVAVLAMRRMPRTFPRPSPGQKWGVGLIAVLGGVLAGAGTYALTGRRGRSPAAEWYLQNTEAETHATNVVNAIITEFRSLDTLVETTVLGVAALSVVALCTTLGLPLVKAVEGPRRPGVGRVLGDPQDNTIITRVAGQGLYPVIAAFSGYLLLRGAQLPGGGFIAGRVAGGALAIAHLAAPSEGRARIHLRFAVAVAIGLLTALAAGFLGFLHGGFLVPLSHTFQAVDYTVSTALLFDAGVFVVVVGTVAAFLQSLGVEHSVPARRADPHGLDEDEPDHTVPRAPATEGGS